MSVAEMTGKLGLHGLCQQWFILVSEDVGTMQILMEKTGGLSRVIKRNVKHANYIHNHLYQWTRDLGTVQIFLGYGPDKPHRNDDLIRMHSSINVWR
uniref:Uncharacterized protein n=1 Tax=Hyaloperonospora arabidopsidis (strain Emoy2) TaxID=559515 RepID=M4BGL3_HYAAE